jgi:broad specificity phosphatase PhoE
VSRLVLVKHSLPAVLATVPAPEWRLSAKGVARCTALAVRLSAFDARAIASSVEPKAVETATLVGQRLGLPVDLVDGLQEHDRTDTKLLGAAAFERAIASLFAQPHAVAFGRETAVSALARFDAAVGNVLAAAPASDDVIVVSHGTVIALFVAAHAGTDGFSLWKALGLPSFVVLDRADLHLARMEAAVG